ncbi:MAG: CoA-binding protein [Bacteroides sp. SM23_62]|nr:MAG: CoA-binding protein [Bacteroides sp. SM23_62]
MSKSVVLGASSNHSRYSNKAVRSLLKRDHEVVPVGTKAGEIKELEIHTGKPDIPDVDTVLLYLAPNRQPDYYDYVISLKPRRVIFNPGTNNPEFIDLLKENGIETAEDCALIMLNSGEY